MVTRWKVPPALTELVAIPRSAQDSAPKSPRLMERGRIRGGTIVGNTLSSG